MSDLIKARGRCLCGATSLTATGITNKVAACHCNICRKWGGGPLMAIESRGEVILAGAENITVFSSSQWAERGFCRQCGTHLFYRLKKSQEYFIPVGLFDEDENIPPWVFEHQVFIDEKPPFYSFANKTINLTGAELFAQSAPPSE